MNNLFEKEFKTKDLIQYALPTIFMMIFMSIYMTVDGVFVGKFVSEAALSAVNIIMPVINVILAFGLMLATGSNAIIARKLGEKKEEEARKFFSLIYIVGIVFAMLISMILFVFNEQVLLLLGTTEVLYSYAKSYLFAMLPFIPAMILQVYTQMFFVTAGKPKIGLISCVIGGLTNIILDYVFIVVFDMGIAGAGYATSLGFAVPGILGLIYFFLNKKTPLYFVKTNFDIQELINACLNGSSEFVSQISTAITTMAFNIILIGLAGESGVAAISVILYIQMIQLAIYAGYSFGVSPILSYKYGASEQQQLVKVNKVSFRFITISSIVVIALTIGFADFAVGIFIDQSSSTFIVAKQGLLIFTIAYIFMGFNIYGSAMFTALGNGKVSALLSALRTLVFILSMLFILPEFLGIYGVWLAVPIAEALAFIVTMVYYKKYKKVYHY